MYITVVRNNVSDPLLFHSNVLQVKTHIICASVCLSTCQDSTLKSSTFTIPPHTKKIIYKLYF